MTHAFSSGCPCCSPPSPSRRQFLCTAAAAVTAAPALAASVTSAGAQTAPLAQPGRSILIRGGCVLSVDRAVGDFEQADVLIEGTRISAMRPNISAPNAEV